MSQADAALVAAVRAAFDVRPPARLGVAVSGGGDSVALLHILTRCFEPGQVEVCAATVDHGLRDGSAQEARDVAALAARLGVYHSILPWQDRAETGNLQDQARRARYRLLTDWAKSNEISVLALGHTADDQAETVLMRLGRAAGVTGLAAMRPRRIVNGITIQRPVLGLRRADLRDYLRRNDVGWVEDPSNENQQFDRIKARRALETLGPLGIDTSALATVAQNMAQADEALEQYSLLAARDLAHVDGGDVVMALRRFRTLPEEIARRLLVHAMVWISGADYPPRRAPVIKALAAIRHGHPVTLGGCRILIADEQLRICREFNAVQRVHCPVSELWDGRWRVTGGDAQGCEIRPLGQRGLTFCTNWRETGRPRAALCATPAVWCEDRLIAAPLAGMPGQWRADLACGGDAFFTSLLTH